MSSDHLGHIEKVQPKKMPQKSLTFSLTSKVPLRTQAHCESLMLTRAQYVPHAHNARAGLREDQSQESPPSPKAFGVSQPSPRPQESPTLTQSLWSPHHHRDRKSPPLSPKAFGVSTPSPRPQESPTLAQSLRSLHTITATARVPTLAHGKSADAR